MDDQRNNNKKVDMAKLIFYINQFCEEQFANTSSETIKLMRHSLSADQKTFLPADSKKVSMPISSPMTSPSGAMRQDTFARKQTFHNQITNRVPKLSSETLKEIKVATRIMASKTGSKLLDMLDTDRE